jgi:hypothetical protein
MPLGRLSRLCPLMYWETHISRMCIRLYPMGLYSGGTVLIVKPYSKFRKKIIRIIMSVGKKTSCRQLFRKLNILPVQSQYILSILLFVTKNKDQFISNSQVHTINTRQTSDLYIPIANLTTYKKGVYYQGIKIYNHLPKHIKDLSNNMNKFKLALKRYLSDNSFYNLKKYFDT